MGEKDITEKTLASYNDVFSDIVNGLLFDGRPVIDPDALSDITPYSMYKADGKVHEQERDVSKFLKTAGNTEQEIRIAFLGFEHQTRYDKDMPLRKRAISCNYDCAVFWQYTLGKQPDTS